MTDQVREKRGIRDNRARLMGTIIAPVGRGIPQDLDIQAKINSNTIGRTSVAPNGEFTLVWEGEALKKLAGQPIDIIARISGGSVVGRAAALIPAPNHIRHIKIPLQLPQIPETPILDTSHHQTPRDNPQAMIEARAGYRLTRILRKLVGDQETVLVPRWVNQAIRELNEASYLAHDLMRGNIHAARRLMALYGQRGNPMPLARNFAGARMSSADCFVRPALAFGAVRAAMELDILAGSQKPIWTYRARDFVLAREEPLQMLYDIALSVDCGYMRESTLQNILDYAGTPSYAGNGGFDLMVEFPEISYAPDSGCVDGSFMPEIDGQEEFHSPCTTLWLECVEAYTEELTAVLTRIGQGPSTSAIGAIIPDASCSGTPTTIVMAPKSGRSFGNFDPDTSSTIWFANGGFSSQADQIHLQHEMWLPDRIQVTLPPGVHSGNIYFRRMGSSGIGGRAATSAKVLGLTEIFTGGFGESGIVPIKTETNFVEIVQQPILSEFSGNGVQDTVIAEGCQPVNVRIHAGFGRGPFQASDEASLERLVISLFDEEGVELGSWPYPEVTLTFTDAETRTLRARVTSEVDGQSCGSDEAELTIERFQRLYLSPASPNHESILSGSTGIMRLKLSCPAPEPITVFLSSNSTNALSVPASVTVPTYQDEVTFQVKAGSNACHCVSITAEAEGFLSDETASTEICVFRAPTVTGFAPNTNTACEPFYFEVMIDCPEPYNSRVRLTHTQTGEVYEPEIIGWMGNRVRCEVDGLRGGQWDVLVYSHGLWSDPASSTLRITAAEPAILDGDLIYFPADGVSPCEPSAASLLWTVRNAERVEVLLSGEVIYSEVIDPCAVIDGGFEHIATGARTYTLRVKKAGENTYVSQDGTVRVNAEGFVSAIQIRNRKRDLLWVWKASPNGTAQRLGSVEANSNRIFALSQNCQVNDIVATTSDSTDFEVASAASNGAELFIYDVQSHEEGAIFISDEIF